MKHGGDRHGGDRRNTISALVLGMDDGQSIDGNIGNLGQKSYVTEEKKQIARAQALPRSLSSTASWLFPDIAADCAISLFTHLSDWCNVL